MRIEYVALVGTHQKPTVMMLLCSVIFFVSLYTVIFADYTSKHTEHANGHENKN